MTLCGKVPTRLASKFRTYNVDFLGAGMHSIKFMSLIAMCATSCLALLLPAIGVVPFPKQLSGINTPGVNALPNAGEMTGTQNFGGASMPGLPISTSGVPGFPSSPTLAGVELPQGPDATTTQSAGINGISKYDTLGFGIWLLLVPIWLLSLVVWSVTPTSTNRSK